MMIKCVTVLAVLGFMNLSSLSSAVAVQAQTTGSPMSGSPKQLQERLRQLQVGAVSVPELPMPSPGAIAAFPTLGSAVFDAQLAGYIDYVETHGTPDILIVGSSRSLQGIDPAALRYRLSGQGYDDLKVYNFSVNGATAQVVNFILSELLPGDLPEVIVWGDGSRAFNDGRRDRTWESLVASEGYQAMLRGEKPVVASRDPESAEGATEGTVEGEAVVAEGIIAEAVEAEAVGAEGILAEEAETEEAETEEAETNLMALLRTAVQNPQINKSAASSFLGSLGLNPWGFAAVSDSFDPSVYYQAFPQVAGQYDGAYSPFTLQGDQTVALAQAAEFVRSQSSQLIFVNLPLSDSYLDAFRRNLENQFQQFLQTQSNLHSFQVVDLLTQLQGQSDLFADPSHINQRGAVAIAAQLALDPVLLLALGPAAHGASPLPSSPRLPSSPLTQPNSPQLSGSAVDNAAN